MFKPLVATAVCLLLPGCLLVSTEETFPGVAVSTELASQFNHRGMPNSDEDVARAELAVTLPAAWQDDDNAATWRISSAGWMELHNDNGDAWFPDGHAGEFVEIDLTADYTHRIGRLSLVGGIVDYVLPNGPEFITSSPAFSERGETKELFFGVGYDVWNGLTPFIEGHRDIDETEGFYGELGLRQGFAFNERLDGHFRVAAGYSDEDHAAWTWGETPTFDAAFAVLLGEFQVDYEYDEATDLYVRLGGSTIIDGEQEDWFETIEVESDNAWILLGVRWSY